MNSPLLPFSLHCWTKCKPGKWGRNSATLTLMGTWPSRSVWGKNCKFSHQRVLLIQVIFWWGYCIGGEGRGQRAPLKCDEKKLLIGWQPQGIGWESEANPQRDKNQGNEWRNKRNVSAPSALRIPVLAPRGAENNSVPLTEACKAKGIGSVWTKPDINLILDRLSWFSVVKIQQNKK